MTELNFDNRFFDFTLFDIPKNKINTNQAKNSSFVVIVERKKYEEENRIFLQKVMSAINLDLAKDIQVILFDKASAIDFSALAYTNLISFGVPLKQLGIHYNIQKYQLLQYNDKRFIVTDDLTKLAADKNLKAALWQNLKQLN